MKARDCQSEQITAKSKRSSTASPITVAGVGLPTGAIPVDNVTSSPNHNYLNNLTSVLRAVTHGRHNLPGYTTVHALGVSNFPGIQSTLSVHILTGAVPPFSHSSSQVRASLTL
jgi:hypothetical protein